MLPARFELHRPESLAEVFDLIETHGDDATVLAGGTELLITLKTRVLRYDHVIDLKRVPGLSEVVLKDGFLSIGALATHHQLANHPLVLEHFPVYARLSEHVANIRVRVAGTLGGNLCFAESHADPPAMLCALGARLRLASKDGERYLPMEDFIIDEFMTERGDDELLLAVEIPLLPTGARAAYHGFGHLERPAASVAAVALPAAKGWEWRFWVGAACGRPTRMEALEQAVNGLDAEAALAQVAEQVAAVVEQLDVHDDIHGGEDYKRHLITVMAQRAAKECMQ